MGLSFFRLLAGGNPRTGPAARRRPAPSSRTFRPTVECLEGRVVLSNAPLAPPFPPGIVARHALQDLSVLPLKVTGINVNQQTGQLGAVVTLGTTSVTAPLSITSQQRGDPTILHLMLGPITLNVAGLTVTTSPICLNISTQTGGPLGNLLSGITNLLNGSGGLLSGPGLSGALTGITDVLNAALSRVTAASSIAGADPNLLFLSVGPVHLNLLGLRVRLDNCSNGPVTVTVSTTSAAGSLLGNLLTDLTGLLNGAAPLPALAFVEGEVAGVLQSLL
jgi:hypothetical protein